MLAADLGHPFDVAWGRRIHAASAEHRLEDERAHGVRADAADLGRECLGIGGVDDAHAGRQRVEADPVCGNPPRLVPRPWVPWQEPARLMMWVLLEPAAASEYRRASLIAVSTASPPPLPRNTFAPGIGASELSRWASASAGGFARSLNIE